MKINGNGPVSNFQEKFKAHACHNSYCKQVLHKRFLIDSNYKNPKKLWMK